MKLNNIVILSLIAWNVGLTLLFLFDKSRIDVLEKSVGRMVKYLCEEKNGENDWK
ncbi:MAG: hypothetical protein PHN69_07265 [Candidatus Pacebacteria bacterium]|nr:hypothetical protein [Candidatus Paceibacterota bacterium]